MSWQKKVRRTINHVFWVVMCGLAIGVLVVAALDVVNTYDQVQRKNKLEEDFRRLGEQHSHDHFYHPYRSPNLRDA
jgi:hypothetical protein